MRIAVTGSLGLLGRHVVDVLSDAGHEVCGIDQRLAAASPVEVIALDVNDFGAVAQALAGCDAVVHCAAIPRPVGHVASSVFANNTMATYNVVEACVLLGIGTLVYASSFSVVGLPFNTRPVELAYLPLDEAHPAAPQDAYALSKHLGEEIVEAAVRRGALSATSIRMPWIQTPESFAGDVLAVRERAVAAANLWSYLDARDAAAGFLAAIRRNGDGHLRVLLAARDTFMEEPTADLVAASYPHVELRRPLEGFESPIGTSLAERSLDWEAQHSWREYR